MRILAVLALAMGTLSSCSRDDRGPLDVAQKACGAQPVNVVADSGIGAVVAGQTVEQIGANCQILRDTVELWSEGLAARIVTVLVGGDTITAAVEDSRVAQLVVSDSGLRTMDSLGVGTTLVRLLALPGVRATLYEGSLHVYSPARCGLGFRVRPDSIRAEDLRQEWTAEQLRGVAQTSPVLEMIVSPCVKSGAPSV